MNELLTNFGVDWKLLLAQVVNFGVLLYLLKRFAYTPILHMLQKRQEIVAQGLRDASDAEKSLKDAEHTATGIKHTAQAEAQVVLESANVQAKAFVSSAKEQGEDEKARIVASAQKDIEALRAMSEAGMEQKTVQHILSGVRAMLREEVDAPMNDRIIQKLTKV